MAEQQIPIGPSSNIASVTWDDETLDLIIAFVHGGGGVYRGVTGNDANGFSSAPSPGKYLNDVIKPEYPYERL
jgi:hypothetical protein